MRVKYSGELIGGPGNSVSITGMRPGGRGMEPLKKTSSGPALRGNASLSIFLIRSPESPVSQPARDLASREPVRSFHRRGGPGRLPEKKVRGKR